MNEKNIQLLGLNVKAERVRKKITQEQLAERINMSLSYVSKLEQGLTSPTALALFKIANVLNVKIESFFVGISI